MIIYFVADKFSQAYIAGPYGSYQAALQAKQTGPSNWNTIGEIYSADLSVVKVES